MGDGNGNRLGNLILGMVCASPLMGAAIMVATPAQPTPAIMASARFSPAAHQWSLEAADALIAEIEQARRDGLDANDYGLAALRSERELCVSLYGTEGSHQIDLLAEAVATKLAKGRAVASGRAPAPQIDANGMEAL